MPHKYIPMQLDVTTNYDSSIISVVISLYNKEHYVSQAIDSVLAQTSKSWELIIVNDGSKDRSEEIVSKYSDPRIRLINQNNQGPAIARNTGIDAAHGDIVAFLDADDQWEPEFLETIQNLSEKYPNAKIYGTAYSVNINGKHLRDNVWKPEFGDRVLSSYFEETVQCGYPIYITSSYAAAHDALNSIGKYQIDYRSGQDHDLFGRAALYYKSAYSPKVCTKYTAGAENNFDRVSYAREVPVSRYMTTLPKTELDILMTRNDIKNYLNFYYLKIGGINVYGGFRKEGRKQLKMVDEPSLSLKKNLFIILSYLPFSLSFLPPKLIRVVANRMKLAT